MHVRWHKGTMHDLGTLGGPDSVAFYVTRSGKIIGQSFTGFSVNATTGKPTLDPFLWEDGKMIDLRTLGGAFGTPNWYNERGQVVGTSNLLGDQSSHPFLPLELIPAGKSLKHRPIATEWCNTCLCGKMAARCG